MFTFRITKTILLLTGLGIATLSGCSLTPGDETDGDLALRVKVEFADVDKSAARADIYEDIADISASARVDRLLAACDDVCGEACDAEVQRAGGGDLTVTIAPDSTLVLAGELSFELGSPGSQYRLTVDLEQRGRRIEGLYAGLVTLGSGLEATLDTLRISDVIPDDLTIDELSLCLDTDIVELDDEERCLRDVEISGTWAPDLNELVIRYDRADVEIEGVESDEVRVVYRAALQPTPIFTGCTELELVSADVGELDVTLILFPTPDTGPGQVGERLAGNVTLDLLYPDGTIEVQESGVVEAVRVEPQTAF